MAAKIRRYRGEEVYTWPKKSDSQGAGVEGGLPKIDNPLVTTGPAAAAISKHMTDAGSPPTGVYCTWQMMQPNGQASPPAATSVPAAPSRAHPSFQNHPSNLKKQLKP